MTTSENLNMTTTAIPDFLSTVRDAGEASLRADRHKLGELVAALAAGKRPSIDAAAVADLLRRINLVPENLEELVATRQRLDALRLDAGREAEARATLRETSASYTKTIEEVTKAEADLRARREQAESTLRQARADVEGVQAAARGAADATGELLRLLAPNLEHDLRTAASGVKVSTSRIGELHRRIEQGEADLRTASENTETTSPELRAKRIEVLEESLAALRRELGEVEEAHTRARQEHANLAAEAALLAGEEQGR